MKTFMKFAVALLLTASLATSFASTSERLKATGESAKGKTQETIGKATDNPKLSAKGKYNQDKGNLRDAKEDIKDTFDLD